MNHEVTERGAGGSYGPYVRSILRKVGALREDHTVLSNSEHTMMYVDKDIIDVNPETTARLANMLSDLLIDVPAESVIGAGQTSIRFSHRVAEELIRKKSKTLWSVPGRRIDVQGFGDVVEISKVHEPYIRGKRVILIEEIVTTGGGATALHDAVVAMGGTPVALGLLWNRHGIAFERFNLPVYALVPEPITTWSAADCPYCKGEYVPRRVSWLAQINP